MPNASRVAAIGCLALGLVACRDSTASEGSVHTRWYERQFGYGYPRPATFGKLVFFGTGDGFVVARDQATGRTVWATRVSYDDIEGLNMVVRDGILAVSVIHTTVGLDAASGSVMWHFEAPADTVGKGGIGVGPGNVAGTHIDADLTTVYVPAWGASVSAVHLVTGATRWVWKPGKTASDTAVRGVFRSGSQGLTVSGDTVFATAWHFLDVAGLSSEAWLVALDRATGRELWRVTMPSYTGGAFVWGAPVVSGDLVVFSSIGGHEYAINRNTQEIAWEYVPNTQNGTFSQTEYYDGIVYHDGGDRFIYALRASDGSRVWRAPFSSQTTTDMLATERRLIFTDGGSIYVLDRATGRQIANVKQPHTWDSFFGSPAAYANGQIFVTVGDGAWSFDEP